MKNKNTGTSRAHDLATTALLEKVLLPLGHKTIFLHDLYNIVRAHDPAEQTGVRWAVRRAKDKGLISKTTVRGVYAVVG